MQSIIDYFCGDCHESFENASLLLKHFAQHVAMIPTTETTCEKVPNSYQKRTAVPDLYPIKTKKPKGNPEDCLDKQNTDENVDSGFEDVNLIKFCQITMDDERNEEKTDNFAPAWDVIDPTTSTGGKCKLKRFHCDYCSKSFGWSTGLKRHLLIHTGERPFKCEQCKLSFTRNFLLQKHKLKYHEDNDVFFNMTKMKIPLLKPLDVSSKHKPRKQDKCNIKRKLCSTKVVYQSNVKSLICSI